MALVTPEAPGATYTSCTIPSKQPLCTDSAGDELALQPPKVKMLTVHLIGIKDGYVNIC